jgi:short-subunit dehydrogenase
LASIVGGTSGIGESTAREFVRHTPAPHVYLVGRSREQGEKLIAEFKTINGDAQTHFIQSDVSLLKNVDEVCKEISGKEEKVNLLVLSAGILTMSGRDGMKLEHHSVLPRCSCAEEKKRLLTSWKL